jgi:hypothetical protein
MKSSHGACTIPAKLLASSTVRRDPNVNLSLPCRASVIAGDFRASRSDLE